MYPLAVENAIKLILKFIIACRAHFDAVEIFVCSKGAVGSIVAVKACFNMHLYEVERCNGGIIKHCEYRCLNSLGCFVIKLFGKVDESLAFIPYTLAFAEVDRRIDI